MARAPRPSALGALVTTAAAFAGGLPQTAHAAPQESRQIDIPAGPLDAALRAFSTLTGIAITMSPDLVAGLTSPGVSGRLTPSQAIAQLLQGSGLTFRFTSPTSLTLELRVRSAQVDVHGAQAASTSPKFSRPIQDVPQTVVIVPAQTMTEQGATSLREVLRNVPGITMQAGEGGGGLPGDTLMMRGFSASGDIFVDGVRDAGAYSRDAFNLEQVEVIKGPAGTFAGRGSTGGAINLATKSPTLAADRSAAVGAGNADYLRTTIDVNQPMPALGRGTSLRLNAMWQDAGVAGRRVVGNGSWALAPTLAAGLGSPTRLTVGYQHLEQHNVPDYGLPWGTYTDPTTGQVYPTGAFQATPAIAQDTFYGLRDYDFERVNHDSGTVRLEHDMTPRLTLRNVTRYGDTVRDHAITAPRPPNRQLQRRWMQNQAAANQTSLSTALSTGAIRHDVVAGLELGSERVRTRNSAQSTNQPSITLQHPDPDQAPLGPMPALAGNPADATTRTAGVYAFDTMQLGAEWLVSGGVRFDRSHVEFEQTTVATGVVTALERTDRMTSWRAGVVYKPRPAGSIYAGAGTSFNPSADAGATGTALSAVDTAATSVNLAPEKTRTVEAGVKWMLAGGRLAANGAVFRTEKTNARTRNLTSDPFVLAGRQRVHGVDLSLSGQIADRWSALAAVSLMRSEIVDSLNAAEAGMDLTLTPKATASVWTTWDVNDRLTVGGGAQFMDAVFRNTQNTLAVPAYWLGNAMASYEINANLTLRVNANNLTDRSYVDRVGGGHYIPGPRRSVQVTAGVRF